MRSLRDVLLVARFELLRAIRTWQALALVMLYLVATTGGAYLVVRAIGLMEQALAETLGVPATKTPGTMLDRLMASDELRRFLTEMLGEGDGLTMALTTPLLASAHLWLTLLLVPFLAASSSAECISVDLRSRALRFEVLRTGRMELVLGRYLGQLFLSAVASLVALFGVWAVGMIFMVGNSPVGLLVSLLWLSLRGWTYAMPWVGLGVGCSQLTASPAWARVLAVGGTAGTWVAYGLFQWASDTRYGLLADTLLPLFPQSWLSGFWSTGLNWVPSALVCAALGVSALAVGYVPFSRRDL